MFIFSTLFRKIISPDCVRPFLTTLHNLAFPSHFFTLFS